MKSFFAFQPSAPIPSIIQATMTTYNETKFSVSRVTTDLQLFFELTQNTYLQDPDFAERWNDYLVEMVSERLWEYSAAVMTNELGNEKYERTSPLGGIGYTLREAFELFAKTSDKDHPQIWKDGEWVDEPEETDDDEPEVRHMILEDSTLTDVDEAPDRDEYELESYIEFDGKTDFDGAKIDGWTEITYKKKGTDENGNPKTDCEECGEVVLDAKIWQSSSRFLCEDCFKEANCCENCGEEPSPCDDVITSLDLMRTLCAGCYKDDVDADSGLVECLFCEEEFDVKDIISKVGGNVCKDCEDQDA